MTAQEKLIRNKPGLPGLASYLGNVSEACRVMGYSRDTFYRLKKAGLLGTTSKTQEIKEKK